MKDYEEKSDSKKDRITKLNSIKYLMNNNKQSKAMKELVRYIEDYPEDYYGQFLYGKYLFIEHDYDNAQDVLEMVANSENNNRYSAMSILGSIHERKNEIDKAREYFKIVITESPYNETKTILEYGRLERRAKNYKKSLKILELADEKDPYTLLEKGKTLLLNEDLPEASVMLSRIDTTDNKKLKREVDFEQGKIEYLFGCNENAKEIYKQLKDVSERDKDYIYYQVLFEETRIALKEEKYKDAIKYAEEIIYNNYNYDEEIYLLLGMANQELGKYNEALKNYRKAAEADNDELKGKSRYYLGTIEMSMGDFEDAKNHLKDSIELGKKFNLGTYFKLITIALKEENYQYANKYLNVIKEHNAEYTNDPSYRIAKIITEKGTEQPITITPNSYIERQLINYNFKDAYKHVSDHLAENAYDHTTPFKKNINLEKLFMKAQSSCNEEDRINTTDLDVYDVDYPNIGTENGEPVNILRIVTIPHTTDILTMYPSSKKAPRPKDFKKQKNKEKQKTNSQIDKFFAKYNITDKK